MCYPRITHHGAADTVTGSCHQLHLFDNASLLVDCGLFQGERTSNTSPRIDFPLAGIHALVLTHVHIDHVGRLPHLLAAGFRGSILCSEASAELLPLVLDDTLRLSVDWDRSTIRRYIQSVQQRLIALAYDQWHPLIDSPALICKLRLQRAGHILGSAYLECDISYRLHEDRHTRQARLETVIEQALANQGRVLIPAFSIGRTQELLYELEDILHRKGGSAGPAGVHWSQLPIILDSPLASRFTKAYRRLKRFWSAEAQQGPVEFFKGIPEWPARIHWVHGEEGAKRALRARLECERPK